jgi:hypothetical protein
MLSFPDLHDPFFNFQIFGCCYMVGNLFFGTLIDKCGKPLAFSMLGNGLFLLAFVFIGPLPFVPVEPSKILIQVKK